MNEQRLEIPPKDPVVGYSGDMMTIYCEGVPAFCIKGTKHRDPYSRLACTLKQLWALDDARKIMKRNGLRPGGPQ